MKGSFFTTSTFLIHLTIPVMFYGTSWRKQYLVGFFLGRILDMLLRNALIHCLKVTGMFLLHTSDWEIYHKWKIWSRRKDIQQRASRRAMRLNESVSRLYPIKVTHSKARLFWDSNSQIVILPLSLKKDDDGCVAMPLPLYCVIAISLQN